MTEAIGVSPIRFSRIAANGIELHVAAAGPIDGPLVFLLHGFPEFWYSWRNQILPLAARGFHVVAPDLRGYNLSGKPKNVASYKLDQLSADILALAGHFERNAFSVVGHDWGGLIAWSLARQYSNRLERLAVLNAPHPAVWHNAMRHNPLQKRKSTYVRFFQPPWLPEILIGLNRFKALSKPFQDSARPDAFTRADLDEYRKAWSQPGALTAMLNYYRALSREPSLADEPFRISCPVLLIWGKRDAYAIPELAEATMRLCDNGRLVSLDNATHWVQHDEPERVTELLAQFLQR